MPPGTFLALFTPLSLQSLLHGLYTYVFPITLHCVWSTLVFLDLAHGSTPPRRALAWTAIVFLLPFAGAGAYLLLAESSLSRFTRRTVLSGGVLIVLAAYSLSFALTR